MKIHGWTIYLHACFEAQLNELLAQARDAIAHRPDAYLRTNAFKRLAAVARLAFDEIPANPADPKYRQGGTLGKHRKHWFRAKFFQQYRLFFRYSESERVIVYAWVNDDQSLRARGSKRDAYATFARMLSGGNPPDDWEALCKAVMADDQAVRLAGQVLEVQRGDDTP
ncbi:MAG: type II toxin-antitoxin system YhaV family toxin [Gammaproteobacteria bacterium]|nr:type II toxin-antitoxin system YhaV family toxin [Gammaproteobacteria bacterium]